LITHCFFVSLGHLPFPSSGDPVIPASTLASSRPHFLTNLFGQINSSSSPLTAQGMGVQLGCALGRWGWFIGRAPPKFAGLLPLPPVWGRTYVRGRTGPSPVLPSHGLLSISPSRWLDGTYGIHPTGTQPFPAFQPLSSGPGCRLSLDTLFTSVPNKLALGRVPFTSSPME